MSGGSTTWSSMLTRIRSSTFMVSSPKECGVTSRYTRSARDPTRRRLKFFHPIGRSSHMQRTNSRLLAASIGMLALLGVVLAACAPAPPPPPPPTTVTSPPPTGPAPTGFGEIQADCPFDHRRADDPIVHAGMPGMAHSHDFFGATTTDASSTAASLHAGSTTCDPALDHSAYWFPTLSDGGAALTPDPATFYYTAETT